MAIHKEKYKITWSTRGERDTEAPMDVEAYVYRAEGEFFAFYAANPEYVSPSLVVRASDVQEIREIESDG